MKNFSDITRAYSGKPGCMCGCNGNYYEPDNKYTKKIYNKVKEHLSEATEDTDEWTDVQIGQRVYVIYWKQ